MQLVAGKLSRSVLKVLKSSMVLKIDYDALKNSFIPQSYPVALDIFLPIFHFSLHMNDVSVHSAPDVNARMGKLVPLLCSSSGLEERFLALLFVSV